MRSGKEIMEQTNTLAHQFYRTMGYHAPEDFKFYTAHHPQEKLMWELASLSQEFLTQTEMSDVISEWEESGC